MGESSQSKQKPKSKSEILPSYFNHIQDGLFWGCSWMGWGAFHVQTSAHFFTSYEFLKLSLVYTLINEVGQ